MSRILICYRSHTPSDRAQRLYRNLVTHFGADNLRSPIAIDHHTVARTIQSIQNDSNISDILLVLLDNQWLSATAHEGWIKNHDDPMRLLIARVLSFKIRLIPILNQDNILLLEQDFPVDLKPLAHLIPALLRDSQWDTDFELFQRQLEQWFLTSGKHSAPVGKSKGGLHILKTTFSRILKSIRKEIPKRAQSMTERGAEKTTVLDECQTVHLGASAPSVLQPGDEFTARFAAYLKQEEKRVQEILHRLSPRATTQLGTKRSRWQPGTKVTVTLSGKHLEVEENIQTFTWDPPFVLLDFDVTVPPETPYGFTILKFNISIDGIFVARLRMDLQITDSSDHSRSKTVTDEAAHTAFASYCSQDRLRVLDRLASVRISAGLDIFMDCLSIRPGDEWKARITQEIQSRDQFLLFWSHAAAESEWVTWEWQTALLKKDKHDMQIHPLDNNVLPPEELSDLHFGDVLMDVRHATSMRLEP